VVDGAAEEVLRSPGPDVGFEHVAQRGSTSAVYLGEGWVLTAAHVGAGEILLDGERYPAVAGSWSQLRGGGSPPFPDLGVFRVEPRPPLPRLALVERAPKPGERVLLVGYGIARGERIEWEGRAGFRLSGPGVRRWGINRIAGTGFDAFDAGMATHAFATLFSDGEQWEAQAAPGDSGGAVFVRRGARWRLAGIMIAVGTFPKQPPGTALVGNATHVADLSRYRDEIRALTGLAPARPPGLP
jgi:hypothetical protein